MVAFLRFMISIGIPVNKKPAMKAYRHGSENTETILRTVIFF